ncbi:MAG: hypothetical protein Q4D58_04015 [Synergistaceae bacterium]|nr:hypothetical protein [Synergistaceae bacterium]
MAQFRKRLEEEAIRVPHPEYDDELEEDEEDLEEEDDEDGWNVNNRKYIPLPQELLIQLGGKGCIRKYYEQTVDKIYEAMCAHKVYYDKQMARCGYPIKDIIPTKEQIRNHIFDWDSFLFGWFAFEIKNREGDARLWCPEDSLPLMNTFIEDVSSGKQPRILRGI